MADEAPSAETRTGECPACKASNIELKDVNGIFICEKCASKRFSSKVRKSIQDAFDRQLAQRQRESFKKRLTLARKGMAQYEEAKFPEALRTFRDYIGILEQHHGVGPGGLSPALFDSEKEAGEILLIAGIYWDLAKIYDRTKGREVDLRLALNKFYEFSADRPHLILASEAMRKFINTDKCIHKEDFRNTHRLLRSKLAKCFIAGAVYGPASIEVAILRKFRDTTLRRTGPGRAFVATYYWLSPPLAECLAHMPWLSRATRRLLSPIVKAIAKKTRR